MEVIGFNLDALTSGGRSWYLLGMFDFIDEEDAATQSPPSLEGLNDANGHPRVVDLVHVNLNQVQPSQCDENKDVY